MTPNGFSTARRALLGGLAVVLVLFLALAGYFLTRRVAPGQFVIRVVPTAPASRSFELTLRGPGGGVLGRWYFQDVPGAAVLSGLQAKIPWKAVSTKASPRQPCVTLEAAASVPEPVLAPIEHLLLSECCPGVTALEACPIRRVVLAR